MPPIYRSHRYRLRTKASRPADRRSLHDAVLEVGHARGLDHAERFELHVLADAREEPRAAAQEDRDDVELDLVHVSRGQVLIDDVGSPADEDVLVAGSFPRLRQADSIPSVTKV